MINLLVIFRVTGGHLANVRFVFGVAQIIRIL